MKQSIIIVYAMIFSYLYTYSMDNTIPPTAYLTYPEKYEEFKLERPYGTFKSHFDCLHDVSNTLIRSYLAQAISIKFNHALLSHNYQEKRNYRIRESINQHRDHGFFAVVEQAIASLSQIPEVREPQIAHILNLTNFKREKDKVFQYHDGTYAKVPDLEYNYAMWDETLAEKKIISLTIPKKGKYTVNLYGSNHTYEDLSICFPNAESLEHNGHEFSIISKSLGDGINTFSSPLKITHSLMSKDFAWLALARKNENRGELALFNLETHQEKQYHFKNPIEILAAGHQYPLFLACNKTGNDSRLISPLFNKNILLWHDSFEAPINAIISPDSHKCIIYGGKQLELYINPTNINDSTFVHWTINLGHNLLRASFTPDSRLLILAFENGSFILLDSLSGDQIKHHTMNWAVQLSHNTPPLFLYSLKNQLLVSVDPVPHQNPEVCTFVIRSLKTGRILSGYNFFPTSPCAMGLTQDERSIIFVYPNDQTVSKLDLYSNQDMQDIDFIENKANIHQLCVLLSTYKKYKSIAKKDKIEHQNASPLLIAMREYIRKCGHENPLKQ